MESELLTAAMIMEETSFCSNMMLELGFDESFGSVPLYIQNTSALQVANNRTYSPRAKHNALRYCFSCKNWFRRARPTSTTSRARISLRTWAPSPLASTVTATSSRSSTSVRLKVQKAPNLQEGGYHLPVLRILAYCSQCSAYFVVIYRGACTLHCSFVAGRNH